MAASAIEWTEMTWNPSTGCTKISSGCKHCYAENMTRRLKAMGMKKYTKGFQLTCHPKELRLPYIWKKQRIIFVNSMSDLFHEDMPLDFIKQVFSVMNDCPQHIFQVLTKRADVMAHYSSLLEFTPNIWMGVTVEHNNYINRIEYLRNIPASVKFLSLEPLLSDFPGLNLFGIDWVIAGGESGTSSRPLKKEWIRNIRDLCINDNVPFFFKQWGGFNKKAAGKTLDDRIWCQMPTIIKNIFA